ncbi:MAG: hypothetical protein ACI4EW_09695 [Butyrivibrio sp.]
MKKFKKFLAAIVAGVMVVSTMAVSALAADGDCAYTDGKTPSYSYTVQSDVTSITATATILMPLEGDTSWNDWCGQGIKVTAPDGTASYYQWGGAQVTWDADFDGDEEPDCVGGVDGENWLATTVDGAATITIPVAGAGTTVDFYVMSWDSYADAQYNIAISGDVASGDATSATAFIIAAVAALAVVATVATKKSAVEM